MSCVRVDTLIDTGTSTVKTALGNVRQTEIASGMDVESLVHLVAVQAAGLIGRLATSEGGRAPMATLESTFMRALVSELEQQGLSQRVIADMFGVSVRTYQRSLLRWGAPEGAGSLWAEVLEFVDRREVCSKEEIFAHFHAEESATVTAMVRDLVKSGRLKTVTRRGQRLLALCDAAPSRSAPPDVALAVFIAAFGPQTVAELAAQIGHSHEETAALVAEWVDKDILAPVPDTTPTRYRGRPGLDRFVGKDISVGVLVHVAAMVSTLKAALALPRDSDVEAHARMRTWIFDVWDGHPHADDIAAKLAASDALLRQAERLAVASVDERPTHGRRRMQVYLGYSARGDASSEK